ncbi:MAG TPA: hypothetical protein DD429_01290 [Clostridiaceae bacterium]|nr:hypothetical protein [Clostridiaceae bacterium]
MYIVCVTSCPTGIAHTFMAAANLKKAGNKMGIEIKIETQGAGGTENKITEDDLKRADGVIVASDVSINDAERFDKLPVLECGVSEAISDPEGIIKELIEGIDK